LHGPRTRAQGVLANALVATACLTATMPQRWRQPSLLDDLERGIAALVESIDRLGIRSVEPRLRTAMEELEAVDFLLFAPTEPPTSMPGCTTEPSRRGRC